MAITQKSINYIFILIQFITIIALAIERKFDYVTEVLLVTSIFVVYIFLENKYRFYVSNYIRVCLMLVIIFHSFVGKYINLYLLSDIFDNYLHVFGVYAVAIFVYSILRCFMWILFTSTISNFLYVTLLGFGIGAIFEILEFIVDITINPRINNQAGLIDTDLDLIADLVGALLAALHVSLIDFSGKLLNCRKYDIE